VSDRERLSTAETMRRLTGGDVVKLPAPEFQIPASLLAPINTDPPPHEEQPPPIVNHHPIVQDLVRRDIDARKQVGIERYGTPLQPFNGRDPLRDLYEELLDAVMYIRQVMYERDRK
jgi:hypothetical protein